MGSALRAPQTTWLVLNGSPETGYPATQSEEPGTGGRTPMVTAPTLVAVLLTVIGDPGSRYLVFRSTPLVAARSRTARAASPSSCRPMTATTTSASCTGLDIPGPASTGSQQTYPGESMPHQPE